MCPAEVNELLYKAYWLVKYVWLISDVNKTDNWVFPILNLKLG